MSRIEQAFKSRRDRAAFIPFLSAGDPNMDDSLAMFRAMLHAGSDILEIGVPYSDPLADGPVIQAAALRSLNAGFSLPCAFEIAQQLRTETDKGLVLFTYINPVMQYTPERFFADAAASGVDGVIIPDLPFEESESIRIAADSTGIDLIPLITPTSGDDRVGAICKVARGFVYCVSSLGVTGERAKMSTRVRNLVETAKSFTKLPVAVGFGVSGPEQARAISKFADGIIVGSAIIRRIEETLLEAEHANPTSQQGQTQALIAATETFAKSMIEAMQRGTPVSV